MIKRKILVFIFICFISSYILTAQIYKPVFRTDTTTWTLYGEWGGPFIAHAQVTIQNNDTILNVSSFSFKVYQSEDNSKVWVNINDSNILVYDITLVSGDTFLNANYYTDNIDYIDTLIVDSTYVNNSGSKTIVFKYGNSRTPKNFIEGLGPDNFLVGGFSFAPFAKKIICKKELDITTYQIDGAYYENCRLKTNSLNSVDFKNSGYSINNPVENTLIIRHKDNLNKIKHISILNHLGTQNSVSWHNEGNELIMHTEALTTGVYFLLIEDEKQLSVKKFIKLD